MRLALLRRRRVPARRRRLRAALPHQQQQLLRVRVLVRARARATGGRGRGAAVRAGAERTAVDDAAGRIGVALDVTRGAGRHWSGMTRMILAATTAAALAGCTQSYYIADVYQHQGQIYVQKCALGNKDRPDPSDCTIMAAGEPPPGTQLPPPAPPVAAR